MRGVTQAILDSPAIKIYICNLMTQANESLGLTAAEHIRALNRHAQAQLFDYALINRTPASEGLKAKYALEGAAQIVADLDAIEQLGCCPVLGDYLEETGAARHATEIVARDILRYCDAVSGEPARGQSPLASDQQSLDSRFHIFSARLEQSFPAVTSVPLCGLILLLLASRYIESRMPTQKTPRIAVAIMAAGKGTRLKSKFPKVLHEVGGKPLLAHVIAAAKKVVPAEDVYAIIGHEAALVRRPSHPRAFSSSCRNSNAEPGMR